MPTPPAFHVFTVGEFRRNTALTSSVEKVEWFGWLPDGEKNEDTITRFDRMYERDRQTDGRRTDGRLGSGPGVVVG